MEKPTTPTIPELAGHAHRAALKLGGYSNDSKNAVLERIAALIDESHEHLLEANQKDLEQVEQHGLSEALVDRLRLTPGRIDKMATGVREIIDLPDPVGHELEQIIRPNGLDIRKVSVPIGVIGIIYESRPNVTIDCAALCIKSGNAAILRGGKEAIHSNLALVQLITEALEHSELPDQAVQLIPTADREAFYEMLKCHEFIHAIVPRGGEGLIRTIMENSRIPVIKHLHGVCQMFIDREADHDLAERLAINAKCQRPGVCNAIENLLIHQSLAETWLPRIVKALREHGVTLYGCERCLEIVPDIQAATEEDYRTEYLELKLAIKIVDDMQNAIDFIHTYGSQHSEAIVTSDAARAQSFLDQVDAATVYWNASTRFTDGFQFGFGAEIGVSTDRLHARGPVGLRELCTYKYQIHGTGQLRE